MQVPILRHGVPYESLDVTEVCDPRDGAVLATVSQANSGLIQRDFRKQAHARQLLAAVPTREILAICERAASRFMDAPEEYLRRLSASTGLPDALCRRNMEKIRGVLANMGTVLAGLTRGLDLGILDSGLGEERGVPLSFAPQTNALGVILPSNSPGVNALWLPAIAFRIPVVLKPGRADPFTPMRIAQAFIGAGCPKEAFSIYPSDHAGAETILSGCGRSILFGDAATTAKYAHDPRVQGHGPGWSKVVIGEDEIARWSQYLDTLASSIADNGGRSCVNASAIVVPSQGDAIAAALAERFVTSEPPLAAFTDKAQAAKIDAAITEGLKTPGAEEVTARMRTGPRLVEREGLTYLLPTIVRCASFDHPLANREFLFPYASIVEVPQAQMIERMGPSLVVTAITRDRALIDALVAAPSVERLNLGPVPTSSVRWDQPHEGNLFEFLFQRRAVQQVSW
jgi:acyl-CoA reductase-like NAD-dependent aldehyde dehydrogenase